jgi:hypothetical protein
MANPTQLSIEMFPASHGDAFLVRAFADDGSSINVLVDSGLETTYREHIKPRLQQLAREGSELRTFVITHIDADHIDGAIELIADNGDSSSPTIIPIRDVWHNSYRHLPLAGRAPTPDEVARVLAQVPNARTRKGEDISARQGSTLAARLAKHNYPWNAAFNGAAVVVGGEFPQIELGNGLRLTLLSPTSQQLQRLGRLWRKELVAMGLPQDLLDSAAFESAFEEIATVESEREESEDEEAAISATSLLRAPDPATFTEDRSITNASSIAFLLEYGSRSALFLGDALPTVIATQLSKLWSGNRRDVDVIKVSHHGSKRSTSPLLMSCFRARHALISTDGSKHDHPDLETLLWIAADQPEITLHFNYETPAAERMRSAEIRSIYKYSLEIGDGRSPSIITVPLNG